VAVLLGDPQRVLADHEIPGDEGVPRLVWRTGSQAEALDRASPALPAVVQMSDRLAIVLEEQVLVIDSFVDFYERLPLLDFSRDILQHQTARLSVLPVPRCGWNDLGTPRRVGQTFAERDRAGRRRTSYLTRPI
jgi:hypothetical protein